MGSRKRLHKEAVKNGAAPAYIFREHRHLYSLTWGDCFFCSHIATDQPTNPELGDQNYTQPTNKFFPKR